MNSIRTDLALEAREAVGEIPGVEMEQENLGATVITRVRVATSDAVEQTVTLGRGAERISSREFLMEISQVRQTGRVRRREESVSRGDIFSRLPPHQREVFERMRRGKE